MKKKHPVSFLSTHIIFLKILITTKMVRIMVIRIMIIKMIRIMVIIGQECPVPAGGQMGSVWKRRLLMNTEQCKTLCVIHCIIYLLMNTLGATQNSAKHCVLYIAIHCKICRVFFTVPPLKSSKYRKVDLC